MNISKKTELLAGLFEMAGELGMPPKQRGGRSW